MGERFRYIIGGEDVCARDGDEKALKDNGRDEVGAERARGVEHGDVASGVERQEEADEAAQESGAERNGSTF